MGDREFIHSEFLGIKQLREMDLHSTIMINSEIEIMKVLGGWIYTLKKSHNDTFYITTAFVPEMRI